MNNVLTSNNIQISHYTKKKKIAAGQGGNPKAVVRK